MDHARFQCAQERPDAAHLHYHGGGLVEFVFRVVDRLRARRVSGSDPMAQPDRGWRHRLQAGVLFAFGTALIVIALTAKGTPIPTSRPVARAPSLIIETGPARRSAREGASPNADDFLASSAP
jgi:hypothetical protein